MRPYHLYQEFTKMTSPFAPVPPRELVKTLADVAVAAVVTAKMTSVISDHTELEKDSLTVRIGSGFVGAAASQIVEPGTHKTVDIVFDFVIAQRNKRNEKKNKKDDTEEK